MFHLGKKVGKFRFKEMSLEDLSYTPEGYYAIARAATKTFSKIQSNYALQKAPMRYFPVVQIMPEENELPYFDPNLVNIQ